MISFFEKLLGSFGLHLNMFNKHQSINSSQNATQVQGNNNRVNSPDVLVQQTQSVPEIEVWLPGNGAKETFEGYIKNHSGQLLVLEYVEVNTIKTGFNQEFRKLIFVRDNKILFPPNIFTDEIKEISLIARYRTINGEVYEHRQIGAQTSRADGKYNISFNSSTQTTKIE